MGKNGDNKRDVEKLFLTGLTIMAVAITLSISGQHAPNRVEGAEDCVWISNTSGVYHSKSHCGSREIFAQTSKSIAEGNGFVPCEECW